MCSLYLFGPCTKVLIKEEALCPDRSGAGRQDGPSKTKNQQKKGRLHSIAAGLIRINRSF
jgi:hypothetical protein